MKKDTIFKPLCTDEFVRLAWNGSLSISRGGK